MTDTFSETSIHPLDNIFNFLITNKDERGFYSHPI